MDPQSIQAIVLDVDGVLTDGRIRLSAHGDLGKPFHVRDGFAVKLWQRAGGRGAILSGRHSEEVARRADELGIELVRQSAGDKGAVMKELLGALDLAAGRVAYVGDDGPDLPAMAQCGFVVAVADAAPAVKKIAHLVTRRRGGDGAVAEFIEWLLRKQGRWTSTG